jgi:hypothetical protein
MNIRIRDGLPYISVSLTHQGRSLTIKDVLIDTGSAGTLFSADTMLEIGVRLEPHDQVRRIYGVGGAEFVFIRQVDRLTMGERVLENFEIEVGAMKYGLDLKGILGMDFLLKIGATIDVAQLTIE